MSAAREPISTETVRRYLGMGEETREALLELLGEGWSFDGKRVLDFGCGPGRTLRHFVDEAREAEFWGADIDPAKVEQVRRDLCPPMHVLRCKEDPPLELEPGFDLIWAISVFTHLTDNSLPWLVELRRLLKPDGLLVATFMGEQHSELLAGEPWEEDRVGMNVLQHDQPWDRGGPMVLMSEWWVREHWGRAFEVVKIAPRVHHQSWALLRRRDVEPTVEELERPADDRREYLAAKHNLRQVQREIEAQEREHERRIKELRSAFERSASWRLTRPLRAARRALRHRLR